MLELIQILCLSWEEIIIFIKGKDEAFVKNLDAFYKACIYSNE